MERYRFVDQVDAEKRAGEYFDKVREELGRYAHFLDAKSYLLSPANWDDISQTVNGGLELLVFSDVIIASAIYRRTEWNNTELILHRYDDEEIIKRIEDTKRHAGSTS